MITTTVSQFQTEGVTIPKNIDLPAKIIDAFYLSAADINQPSKLQYKMAKFHLRCDYQPTGDQPAAIAHLTDGLAKGEKNQTLLGVTGSGKTYTMANLIKTPVAPRWF